MKTKFILVILIFAAFKMINAQEVLDKIAAVVDDEIIMQSELNFQINLIAAQRKIDPNTPGLKKQVLNAMIEDKLVYAQATLDSITVSEDEIKSRIDYQINLFIQQYGSREKVEEVYGMSIEKMRRELHDDVKKNIMSQRLQEKKFGSVEATRREVEDFYNKFKDSLGVIPEKVQIAHIFRNPKATDLMKQKYKEKAQAILDSIKAGADFATMAKKYSEDPGSASQGGDLGFVKRGVFYPEFEAAAFALQPGEISDVIESPVGFHIIQMIEKRGESIHTRHILIKIKNDEQADLKTIEFLNDVRDSIVKGKGSFADFAKKYSEDKDTQPFGGELGTFYLNQLDKTMLDVVSNLKEGDISFPKRIDFGKGGSYGYHIVYLEKRTPQHVVDLQKDYTELKKLAVEYKKQELYKNWIAELKKKIYWQVRV
jgi:peptidyl-prolyl cis-trans isomerase SurA